MYTRSVPSGRILLCWRLSVPYSRYLKLTFLPRLMASSSSSMVRKSYLLSVLSSGRRAMCFTRLRKYTLDRPSSLSTSSLHWL